MLTRETPLTRPDTDRILKRYIAQEMHAIWGNLHPVDAVCYAALLTGQTASGVSGSAVEIGVSQGRSLFLMVKAMQPGEEVYGIDLFDHDQFGNPGVGQLDAFKAYARRLGLTIPDRCLHIGPSEGVSCEDILGQVGPARFFSIDGGHMEHHVKADAALASRCMVDAGIIIFDDFCNPEWPETSMAVLDFLRQPGHGLVAFAITKDKLFVCQAAHRQPYIEMLTVSHWLHGYRKRRVDFLGSHMLWVQHDVVDRLIYHGLERVGLGRLAFIRQARRRT